MNLNTKIFETAGRSFLLKCIIGCICFLLGCFVSPQSQVSSDVLGFIKSIVPETIIFGVSLASASFINGHNERMFRISKIDCVVNVFIAAIIGSAFAIILIYCLKFYGIGRWIVLITLIGYSFLTCCLCALPLCFKFYKIRVLSLDQRSLLEAFDDLRGVIADFKVEVVTMDSKSLGIGDVLSRVDGRMIDYILPGKQQERIKFREFVGSAKMIPLVHSLSCFFEAEFGLIYPLPHACSEWWDVQTNLRSRGFGAVKRWLDVIMALSMAIPAIPVVALAGIMVKISDGGTVFYKQVRLGRFGKQFTIYKLRTMTESSEVNGAQWAAVGDVRVTKFGDLLRKTRVDELPQLWNILRGDMSWVGPRPERPEFYSIICDAVSQFDLRLLAKPGLTGWAQINYPYGASVRDSRNKLLYDLYYIKNASLLLDLRILTRTIVAMMRGGR